MKFIVGKKIGMSQIFKRDKNVGIVIPVTLIESDCCVVTYIRTKENDGYNGIQVGFLKKKKIKKQLAGHLKDLGNFRHLMEFRTNDNNDKHKVGDEIKVSVFESGDKVKVSGISKAKGFQGVMKRHGFKCGHASHGQKHSNRKPGSIGTSTPQHVVKGRKMAGRMGGVCVTQRGLEIVEVIEDKNLLLIKGSVPGKPNSILKITSV